MDIKVKCNFCGVVETIPVDSADYTAWKGGKLTQDAFPYLDADRREMLISKTCGGCWDMTFFGIGEDLF